MGLRVLITNVELWPVSGTVLYVRDLALELQRQGHDPVVFSDGVGHVAREVRAAGITVTDNLRSIHRPPDVIHGHHHAPTMMALRRWPSCPAIFVCHDHRARFDRTPLHPSIRRYLGVSRVCIERLLAEGSPEDRTGSMLNFVDARRFTPRQPLPERPRRGLLFSNYARSGTHLPAVSAACAEAGLELDVIGAGVGNEVTRPEELVGQYDIVFAKAKAAMEAMAVGTAVVLCDFSGVGPMVTSTNFDDLRPLNFGYQALGEPLSPAPLLREIARYDRTDAVRVRDRLRAVASLEVAAAGLVELYREVITEQEGRPRDGPQGVRAGIGPAIFLRLYWLARSVIPRRRDVLRGLPGVTHLQSGMRRLLGAAE